MSDRHKEIEVPPYKIVINVDREYLPGRADPNGGFFARLVITRLDGQPVYKNFSIYQIGDGNVFEKIEQAKQDAEDRARKAIADGFPES